jgi:hypothetical protein
VKEQRPKVTYETQLIQVPKTIMVPKTIKDTRLVPVDKEVLETEWIPIQVPRALPRPTRAAPPHTAAKRPADR